VYVTGYSSKEDPSDIKKVFKKFGTIEEFSWKGKFCFIVHISYLNICKQYEEAEEAEKAVKKMNKEDYNEHTLVCEVARSQKRGGDGVCYTCGKKGHL
jgi:arginine/serine-rich splicing factor 7